MIQMNLLSRQHAKRERAYLQMVRQVDALIDALRDGQWHAAKSLMKALHTTDRNIRKLAELSDGRILSGNAGYKMTRYATPEDMREFVGRQLSQIDRTKERLARTEKCWHGRAA